MENKIAEYTKIETTLSQNCFDSSGKTHADFKNQLWLRQKRAGKLEAE